MKKIKSYINKVDKDGITELYLSGTIGKESMFYDSISSKSVRNALENAKGDIHIFLNSGGGDVFEGIEIYNYLKNLNNKVTVEITALAASAASIIAMAADNIIIDLGANIMIHEASTLAYGNKSDIKKTLNALESIDKSLIDIYVDRTNLSPDLIEKYLKEETWFNANKSLELGFADEIKEIREENLESKKDNSNINIDEIADRVIQKINNINNSLNENIEIQENKIKNFINLFR